jgi:hypothetical protein
MTLDPARVQRRRIERKVRRRKRDSLGRKPQNTRKLLSLQLAPTHILPRILNGAHTPIRTNYRELEQCVKNVRLPPLARGEFRSRRRHRPGPVLELLSRYATIAYHRLGSYEAAASRLGLDRRTLKANVDPVLLARLRGN